MADDALFRTLIPASLEDRLQEALTHAMAKGADGAEAYVSVSRSTRAKVQNGALEDLSTSKRGGVGIRILWDGRTGIATTTDLGRQDFRELALQAQELATLGDQDPWLRQADPEGEDDLPLRYDTEADAFSGKDRVARALFLEAKAREASPTIAAVREAVWADGVGASLLLTQRGVRAFDVGGSCSAHLEVVAEQDGDRQTGWHWNIARAPRRLDLAAIGRDAALKAERKLKPLQLSAGRYPVVLHPEVTIEFLGIVAGMLSAEAVLKQRSLFAGKLGATIASPRVTLVDHGRLPGGIGTEPWDGEGLPTRRNVLIQDGVLTTYLHTLKTAAQMGLPPTASAHRTTASNPGVTTFNLYPLPGPDTPEQLYAQVGEGVLITEVMGMHTVDPVSGNLSIGASGIRIREGCLAESVDRLTLAGNLRDLLQGIVAVGNDLQWYGTSAGVSLLLEDVALGGA